MILIMLITAFLCLLSSINAHDHGAPASVCDSMLPSHGAGIRPQTGSVPYSIFISPANYSSGSTVTVTLTEATFKGYILEMRRMDNQAIIGEFSVPNGGQLLSCGGQNNAAVTHTENGDKTSVNFTWTAPAQSVGPLQVVATVVQDKTTFWTMVKSRDIDVSASPSTSSPPGGGGQQPTTADVGQGSTTAGGGQQTTTADVGQGSTTAGGGQQTTTADDGRGSTTAGGGQQTTTADDGQGTPPSNSAAFTVSSFLGILGAVVITVLIL